MKLTLVVPAAGIGSRLNAVCLGQPKCLLEIGDRRILHYAMDAGLQGPIDRIVLIVSPYGQGAIFETIGDSYRGVPISYVEQATPLGLAHAVTLAAPYVSDAMVVVNGDEIYADSRHEEAAYYFIDSGCDAVVGCLRTDDRSRISIGYGMDLRPDGRIVHLDEKPPRPWNDVLGVGTWFLNKSWFVSYERTPVNPARRERDFVAVIQTMIDSGSCVHSFDLKGRFYNINTSADLERARSEVQRFAQNRRERTGAAT